MDSFTFTQPATVDQAVQAAAKSATAQQGAQVRFVAGGTTLIDLMKRQQGSNTGVVEPARRAEPGGLVAAET